MEGTSDWPLENDELLKLAEVSSLKNHPGWLALKEHIQAKIDQTVAEFSRAMLNGQDFDQRKVDRTRGQVNALRAVLNATQLAAGAYERAKRKAV